MALTPLIRVSQSQVMAAGNIQTAAMRVSQAVVNFDFDANGGAVRVPQAHVLAAVLGRVSDPKIRAWTFTLDGHDFYVLRLGNDETLIYDRLSEQWYNWGSDTSDLWRAYTGQNWEGGQDFLARNYGSNILVGDDGNGALYFLDPRRFVDDDALEGAEIPRTFLRRITGQQPTRSVDFVDDFGVQLIGSIGDMDDPTLTAITLYTSDDQGETYDDQGTITVDNGEFNARVEWRSLGSYNAPGRLYRIDDVGALQRVDYLDTLGDEDDGKSG